MKRNTRIDVRTTPEEKETIQQRAKAVDYSAAQFMRECGLLGKVQPVLSINLHQWTRLAGGLSNLNQAIRLCNKKAIPEDLLPTLLEVKALLLAIRQDLITKQKARE